MNKKTNFEIIVKSALVGSGIGLYLAGYEQLGVVTSITALALWLACLEMCDDRR